MMFRLRLDVTISVAKPAALIGIVLVLVRLGLRFF